MKRSIGRTRKKILVKMPVQFEVFEDTSVRKLARIFYELGFEILPSAKAKAKRKPKRKAADEL